MASPTAPVSQIFTIEQARQFTGLDLVSSREVVSLAGKSYFELENEGESESHSEVRKQAISYFMSLGYHVFTEGVGIAGVFTLADFVAMRQGRTVFVEVLSDSNIKEAVLARKAQLQVHAELCFVLFTGTKRACLADVMAEKLKVSTWADVLFCSLNRYSGIFMQQNNRVSVAYETTQSQGIVVRMVQEPLAKSKSKLVFQFVTHRYENPFNTPISSPVFGLSYDYESAFLEILVALEKRLGARLKVSRRNFSTTAYRAMRRPGGLRLVDCRDKDLARLRSEYRGNQKVQRDAYHVHTLSLPVADFFCSFEIDDRQSAVRETLLEEIRRFPMQIEGAMVPAAIS
jgi:hypothetical protein